MKRQNLLRFIAVFMFMAMAYVVQAQVSLSCNHRTTCLLDDEGEVVDCMEEDESSLFVFNDDETVITHTTETAKSTYYVQDRDYDESDGSFTYYVTSDTGKDYLFFVFPEDKSILVIFVDSDDDAWAVFFDVKAIF